MAIRAPSWTRFICIGQCTSVRKDGVSVHREALCIWNEIGFSTAVLCWRTQHYTLYIYYTQHLFSRFVADWSRMLRSSSRDFCTKKFSFTFLFSLIIKSPILFWGKKKKLENYRTTEAQTLTGQTWYFFRCTVIAIYLSLSRNNMVFSRSNNSKWIHCEQRKVCTLLLLLTSCLLNQQCHAV